MEKVGSEEREKNKEFEVGNTRLSIVPISYASNSDAVIMSFSPENHHDDPGKRKLCKVLPQHSHYLPNKSRRSNTPNGREAQKSVVVLKDLVDDGYGWRKYGQKDILGAKFPREYYRCTYRDDQGCYATKMVQRVNEANGYEITYRGRHTCRIRSSLTAETIGEEFSIGSYSITEYWGSRELAAVSPSFCERDAEMSGSENHNGTISNEIRHDEPAISSIAAHKEFDKQRSTVSAFSASNKAKKGSGNAIKLLDFSHSMSTADNLGGSKEQGNLLSSPKLGSSRTTECTLHKLMVAVKDVKARKIGIYGHGGIGKTTVMKALFSECVMKRLFDLVLWVSTSRCSSRRKILNALVQQLSLNVSNFKSDDELAIILNQALQSRNFVLFFDDVWDFMDLQNVGIPIASQENNYKIILTTRSLNICHAMEVDTIIKAEALSREEALQLFHVQVGDVMDSQDISPYARAIVEECCGLPLTIKVVGRALSMDNSVLTWKLALKEVLLNNNIGILRLGYNRLKAQDVKSCFLYSVLFAEGKAIGHSSLVEYLIDEGFIAGSMSDARRRGSDIINFLVDASLLECSDDGSMVKMHDTIRDLALMILLSDEEGLRLLLSRYLLSIESQKALPLGISSPTITLPETSESADYSPTEGHLSVLTATEGLNEAPSEKQWEESRIACLMDSAISSLPKRPACSKLVTLFLQRNSNLRAIPHSFFEHMSSLQILNLSKTRIKSLPQSLSKLQCLQILIMRNCERLQFLPPVIGALKNLLVLDLHGTEICELPVEISELRCLTCLNVNFYGAIDQNEYGILPSQLISKGIISNLNELRELGIVVHPGDARWTKGVLDVMMEVNSLKLRTLSFHFPEIKHLEHFINKSTSWAQRTLSHFNFIVGHDVKRMVSHIAYDLEHKYALQDRCLRFVNCEDIPEAVGKVLSEATAFYLDHHLKVHSLTQLGYTNFNKLKFCIVRDCPQLKAIANCRKGKGSCFPYLEHLSIHYLSGLRKIWVGPARVGSFSMLRRLSVISCPRLEYLLSHSMVAALSSLEELIVEDCLSLRNLVINQDQCSFDDDIIDSDFTESSVANSNDTIVDDTDVEMEVMPTVGSTVLRIKVLKLIYLPKLEHIWSGGNCPCLEYLSVYNCPSLRNLYLKPESNITLKEIKIETSWWDRLEWQDPVLQEKLQGCVQEISMEDIWGKV